MSDMVTTLGDMPIAKPTSIRLEPAIIRRVDALVPRVQLTRYGDLGELSRSKLLRLAILRGLEVLEAEAATAPKAK